MPSGPRIQLAPFASSRLCVRPVADAKLDGIDGAHEIYGGLSNDRIDGGDGALLNVYNAATDGNPISSKKGKGVRENVWKETMKTIKPENGYTFVFPGYPTMMLIQPAPYGACRPITTRTEELTKAPMMITINVVFSIETLRRFRSSERSLTPTSDTSIFGRQNDE